MKVIKNLFIWLINQLCAVLWTKGNDHQTKTVHFKLEPFY